MLRILITGMTENPGGIEAYIMNIYRNVDHSKLQFDFIVNSNCKIAYNEEISAYGGQIFRLHGRRENPLLHLLDYYLFFKNHSQRYNGIYVNALSLANIDAIKLAYKFNIKKRILHAHNNADIGASYLGIRTLLHKCHRYSIKKYATHLFACSNAAGKWMFGKKAKYAIINNAIDTKNYRYNSCLRSKLRKKLNISSHTFVIGTVGRLEPQKNPLFLIDIFYQIKKTKADSLCLHIGDGTLKHDMEERIKHYQIQNDYRLLGSKPDTSDYYQIFDAFIFPSLFEGLGISLIEAQACDLPCFISDTIPQEAILLKENVHCFSLQADSITWANGILANTLKSPKDRIDVSDKICVAGFDIMTEVKKIEKVLYDD